LSDTPVFGSGPALEASFPNRGSTADVAADELVQGVELGLVATSRVTLRPLEITGLAGDLAVHPSRAEALAGGSGGGPDSVAAPRTS